MFKHGTIPVLNQRTANATCQFEGFHLSYNPRTADYGTDTSAIVFANRLFFILNGNHRQPLLEAAQNSGLQGVIDYFIDNIEKANYRSEHFEVIKGEELFGLAHYGLESLGQPNLDRIAQAMQPMSTTR